MMSEVHLLCHDVAHIIDVGLEDDRFGERGWEKFLRIALLVPLHRLARQAQVRELVIEYCSLRLDAVHQDNSATGLGIDLAWFLS